MFWKKNWSSRVNQHTVIITTFWILNFIFVYSMTLKTLWITLWSWLLCMFGNTSCLWRKERKTWTVAWRFLSGRHHGPRLSPYLAEFIVGDIRICLHSLSFVTLKCHGYFTTSIIQHCQYTGCWRSGDQRSQDTSKHRIDLAVMEYSGFKTKRDNTLHVTSKGIKSLVTEEYDMIKRFTGGFIVSFHSVYFYFSTHWPRDIWYYFSIYTLWTPVTD